MVQSKVSEHQPDHRESIATRSLPLWQVLQEISVSRSTLCAAITATCEGMGWWPDRS